MESTGKILAGKLMLLPRQPRRAGTGLDRGRESIFHPASYSNLFPDARRDRQAGRGLATEVGNSN